MSGQTSNAASSDRPLPDAPRIAIVGSGAVGGFYGARLARAGFAVDFLLRSDYAAVCEHGWQIKSPDGDFHLPAGSFGAFERPGRMPCADLVIVALKTAANDQLHDLIGPLLAPHTAILTLQNGLGNEADLADCFGAQRVVGGMAFVCLNRTAPGVIEHIDHGQIKVGEYRGKVVSRDAKRESSASLRAKSIARCFERAGIRCEVLDDLLLGRWEKLVWNIPFNGLGAALDLTTDRLLASEAGTKLVTDLMHEVAAIAAAAGVVLPVDIIERNLVHTRSMGAYRSSMQIDRQLGRPLEVESIIARPVAEADRLGVKAGRLRQLLRLVAAVNLGKDDPAR